MNFSENIFNMLLDVAGLVPGLCHKNIFLSCFSET